MSDAKHTPAPWNLVWWGNERYPFPLSVLADNDGAWVARDGTVSSEANAHLIAAAPDLLEACEWLLSFVENTEGELGIVLGSANSARAAIAKAKGKS